MRVSTTNLNQRALNCISKIAALAACVVLSACAGQNDDAADLPVSDFARNAAYPSLLDQRSVDAAIAGQPNASSDFGSLQVRAAALKARAERLARLPVLTAAERAQMQDAVQNAR